MTADPQKIEALKLITDLRLMLDRRISNRCELFMAFKALRINVALALRYENDSLLTESIDGFLALEPENEELRSLSRRFMSLMASSLAEDEREWMIWGTAFSPPEDLPLSRDKHCGHL